jgi:copper chaperone
VETILTAPDISCEGCANAIRKALGKVVGVGAVSVDVATKAVQAQYEAPATHAAITAALDRAGFPVAESLGGPG